MGGTSSRCTGIRSGRTIRFPITICTITLIRAGGVPLSLTCPQNRSHSSSSIRSKYLSTFSKPHQTLWSAKIRGRGQPVRRSLTFCDATRSKSASRLVLRSHTPSDPWHPLVSASQTRRSTGGTFGEGGSEARSIRRTSAKSEERFRCGSPGTIEYVDSLLLSNGI
jgi:hypothetical protein